MISCLSPPPHTGIIIRDDAVRRSRSNRHRLDPRHLRGNIQAADKRILQSTPQAKKQVGEARTPTKPSLASEGKARAVARFPLTFSTV